MDNDEEDFEIDTRSIFKQAASELTTVTDLEGTLGKFGFAKDDRIERREMVMMYHSVAKEMEGKISELAYTTDFDGAKNMRTTLNGLKGEFCDLQTNATSTMMADQTKYFDKASKLVTKQLKATHLKEEEEMYATSEEMLQDEERMFEIERANLEQIISRIPRPPIKYSKRMIELIKAESGLIKLCQYEEAKKVRFMIDRILPKETKDFYAAFDASIEAMREKLRRKQTDQHLRKEEKIKSIQWDDIRRREMERKTSTQRISNHLKDMSHSHILEKKLKPELSIKPSALCQKRPGYNATGASLRGQQLLRSARSGPSAANTTGKVIVDTLVDKHDFEDPLPDTVAYSG